MATDQIMLSYTNYRGETGVRNIRPIRIYWGVSDWHPEPGFLLHAWDIDKQDYRDFALKDCNFTQGK